MDIQAEVTKRIQAEIGNLIVQLTMKGIECEMLQRENAELKQQLVQQGKMEKLPAGPDSGHHKEKSNGN